MSLDSPPCPTLPAEEKGDIVISDGNCHADNVDASSTDNHLRADSSEIIIQPAYEDRPRTDAVMGNSTVNIEQPRPSPPQGHAGPAPGVQDEATRRSSHERRSSERERPPEKDGETTLAEIIEDILSKLPLSKLKIVIVVWQILLSFSEITGVTYPPIFETFLSFIEVFNWNLTWILSASCLMEEVTFYDKLLMVTLGPLAVLVLLGITFHIGKLSVPVAVDGPVRKQAHQRRQTDLNEPPSSGPVLRRGTPSGDSEGAVDVSRGGDTTRGADASAGLHPTAAGTGDSSLCSGRPGTAAGGLSGQAQRTSRVRRSSITDDRSASLNDSTVNDQANGQMGPWSCLGCTRNPCTSPSSAHEAAPEKNPLSELVARHTKMSLILLLLVYSEVSTVVFQTFACEQYPEINASYIRADQRIECYTATHTGYRAWAGVMILLYPVGIPMAFFYLLRRNVKAINPTDKTLNENTGPLHKVLVTLRQAESIEKRGNDHQIAPTSILWSAYYPNSLYFEVYECARRLLLTGLLVFIVPDTSGQVAISCLIALSSLVVFELVRPHTDSIETHIYRTGCLTTFFTNFLALMIKVEVADETSSSSAVFSVALIMVNIMLVLAVGSETAAVKWLGITPGGFQGATVGVQVSDKATSTFESFLQRINIKRTRAGSHRGCCARAAPTERPTRRVVSVVSGDARASDDSENRHENGMVGVQDSTTAAGIVRRFVRRIKTKRTHTGWPWSCCGCDANDTDACDDTENRHQIEERVHDALNRWLDARACGCQRHDPNRSSAAGGSSSV